MKFPFTGRMVEHGAQGVMDGQTDWLDAPGLAAWVGGNTSFRAHGDEIVRQVESWRWSKRVNAYDADEILTQLHVNLNELPPELWIRYPRGELKQAALDLLARGEMGIAVAAKLGVTPGAVSKWKLAASGDRSKSQTAEPSATRECQCDPRIAVTHDLEGDEICTACGKLRIPICPLQ